MHELNPSEYFPSREGSVELFVHDLERYGMTVEKEARATGAYRVALKTETALVTVRLLFGDYSGSDVVITNMTTFPEAERGHGYGKQAIGYIIDWAKVNNLKNIRATQVQSYNEEFWKKNGFLKVEGENSTGDFIHEL